MPLRRRRPFRLTRTCPTRQIRRQVGHNTPINSTKIACAQNLFHEPVRSDLGRPVLHAKNLRFRFCSNWIGTRGVHQQSGGASVPGCDIARRANLSHVPGIALSGKSKRCSRPSRTRKEGRLAIVTDVGSGMRWTHIAGRNSFVRRAAFVRTAKSCGSGAPMQALSLAGRVLRGDGGNQAGHRGDRV
jgi:hypothetical protein